MQTLKTLLIVEAIPDRRASEGKALKQALEIMKKGWDGRTTTFKNKCKESIH